jgi:hypothetical protein
MNDPDFITSAVEDDGVGSSMTDYANSSQTLRVRAIAKTVPDLGVPLEIDDFVDHGLGTLRPGQAALNPSKGPTVTVPAFDGLLAPVEVILKQAGSLELAGFALQDTTQTVMRHHSRLAPSEKTAMAAHILIQILVKPKDRQSRRRPKNHLNAAPRAKRPLYPTGRHPN